MPFAFAFDDGTVGGCDFIVVFAVLGGEVYAPFGAAVVAVVFDVDIEGVGFSDAGMLEGDLFGLVGSDFTGLLWAGLGGLLCVGLSICLGTIILGGGCILGSIAVAAGFAIDGDDGAAGGVNFVVVTGVVSACDEFDVVVAAAIVAVEFVFGDTYVAFCKAGIFDGDACGFLLVD